MIVTERGTVEITRVFDFPRESVFRMWTDPKMLAKWWGPEGNVTLVCEVDPRPGGAIRIDERLPDGTVHVTTGSFTKIVASELMVFRIASPGVGPFSPFKALNTVTFEELGPKRTRLTVVVSDILGSPEQLEALKQGFTGGWAQSIDKLQKALSAMR